MEQWARGEGVDTLYLHVAGPMARARAFYESAGFSVTGDVIAMDRDPSIQRLTMKKNLV